MSNTLINDIEVRIEGYPIVWRTGAEVMDVTVTLGQNERSSNCKVVLADPDITIAEALIKHTEKAGGIKKLPAAKASVGISSVAPTSVASGTVSQFTPHRRAFLDLIAWAEGANYNTVFGGGTFKNFKDHPDLTGELVYGGVSNASGRYQFMAISPPTWENCKRALGLKDFSPASQDQAAIYLIQQRGALADVDAGNIAAALEKVSYEWASLPPYRHPGQGTKTKEECIAYFNSALARYQGSNVAAPVDKTLTTDTQVGFKGSKIFISSGNVTFEFFHQGTKTNHEGRTTLIGQGIRWALSRRKRSKTESNVSLKQLAQKVAAVHKLKLDWQADFDIQYVHIAQQGISDYALLRREATRSGLFLSENGTTLVVKSLRNLRDTAIVLRPGLNLISWEVSDEALDDSKEDAGSSLAQSEPKTQIDPLTGAMVQTRRDIDTVADKSVSGKSQATPSGTLQPGQEAIAQSNASRVKRVKGLPSVFTVPLTVEMLAIQPLDAVRTQDLKGCLNRVWLVDTVTHNFLAGTTQLNVYSPIEIIVEATGLTGSSAPGTVSSGGYIYPVLGYPVTDVRRWRSATRFHHAIDFGTPTGTPIKAMANGTVTRADGEDVDGYGLVIYIKHPDGKETRYGHLSEFLVKVGQQVQQGQIIGKSGATGRGTGAHLHAEIRGSDGNSLDWKAVGFPDMPVGFIPK